VAAIRAVGVRGDPCGALHNTEIDRQDFKFSVFKNFKNFKLLSNFNEVQTYSLMMIC